MPIDNTIPECTGFVSKLTKNTAWVRLNFTTEHFDEESLTVKAKSFLMSELVHHGRSAEIKGVYTGWTVTRFKYAVPLFGRNTALVYMKRKDS